MAATRRWRVQPTDRTSPSMPSPSPCSSARGCPRQSPMSGGWKSTRRARKARRLSTSSPAETTRPAFSASPSTRANRLLRRHRLGGGERASPNPTRHPGEGRDPLWGRERGSWIPAFAGMTKERDGRAQPLLRHQPFEHAQQQVARAFVIGALHGGVGGGVIGRVFAPVLEFLAHAGDGEACLAVRLVIGVGIGRHQQRDGQTCGHLLIERGQLGGVAIEFDHPVIVAVPADHVDIVHRFERHARCPPPRRVHPRADQAELFLIEHHEMHRSAARLQRGEPARDFQHDLHPAAIVIDAGAARHGVVMRGDHDMAGTARVRRRKRGDDIRAGEAALRAGKDLVRRIGPRLCRNADPREFRQQHPARRFALLGRGAFGHQQKARRGTVRRWRRGRAGGDGGAGSEPGEEDGEREVAEHSGEPLQAFDHGCIRGFAASAR
ncbi:hypothetical protein ERY430_41286 [Erythrobacter sp. EC-HK427]|nr:hypothetical protein ERY430_41286 [Erythrobacter sp. EC-HK427]